MTLLTPVLTDHQIQRSVQEELDWTSDVAASGIGVAVEDGAVTISGEVATYLERLSACRAALRVHGVRTLVDALTVHSVHSSTETETVLAGLVQTALTGDARVPDTVKAELHGRSVVLVGEVRWNDERESARHAVARVPGVENVTSLISLGARATSAEALQRISEALHRDATIDSGRIHAHLDGSRLTLTGTVRSWAERRSAERAAWSSPSITHLDNELVVASR